MVTTANSHRSRCLGTQLPRSSGQAELVGNWKSPPPPPPLWGLPSRIFGCARSRSNVLCGGVMGWVLCWYAAPHIYLRGQRHQRLAAFAAPMAASAARGATPALRREGMPDGLNLHSHATAICTLSSWLPTSPPQANAFEWPPLFVDGCAEFAGGPCVHLQLSRHQGVVPRQAQGKHHDDASGALRHRAHQV